MLTATEQLRIIEANHEAFEELALRWPNPQTGEPESDLKQAVLNMVCDYFNAPGCASMKLLKLISDRYDAAEEDDRLPIELTDENQIPDQVRAVLKRLGPDDNLPPGRSPYWFWDDGTWAWELLVRDHVRDIEDGYVAIVPLKDGRRFEYEIKPPPSHSEWALHFVAADIAIPDILVRRTLHQAKHRLDMLLGSNTPEIPSAEEW
jgi:hypothetical protein